MRRGSLSLTGALALALIGVGTGLHLWCVFHLPINSDEAVSGLMARAFAHGHFLTFYPGEPYGGSAEEVVMAAFGAVFGYSGVTVQLTVAALFAVSAVLTWRIARYLVADAGLAALGGAIAWTGSLVVTMNETFAYGFRAMTMVCGLVLVLVATRTYAGRFGPADAAALGLAAGVGWWSSPEIDYFALPAACLLAAGAWRHRSRHSAPGWAGEAAVALVTAVVGALPWIWTNAHDGWKSLTTANVTAVAHPPDYAGRFRLYFRFYLPMMFDLRHIRTGAWIGGHAFGVAAYLVVLVVLAACVVACVAARGPSRALAVGVVGFPFLLALPQASTDWPSGRYGIYDWPLLALALTVGAWQAGAWLNGARHDLRHGARHDLRPGAQPGVRPGVRHPTAPRHARPAARPPAPAARIALGAAGALLGAASVVALGSVAPAAGSSWWSDPNDQTTALVHQMQTLGLVDGYAGYWVAYRLDFLSAGRLHLTTVFPDPQRDGVINQQVDASARPVWIFNSADDFFVGQFLQLLSASLSGPAGITEQQLETYLTTHHIGYRVVPFAIGQAVVPDGRVTPADLGRVRRRALADGGATPVTAPLSAGA